MGVYLLWGEDDFRLEKALLSLRSKVLGEDISPLNHRVLKTPDAQTLLENIQTTGMMFGNLLIEVHSRNLFMRTKEKEVSKEDIDRLVDALEYLAPTVSVVFVCQIEKGANKKIDGASKIVKSLKKIGEVVEFQTFKSYQTKDISDWIIQNAKEKGLVLRPDAAAELHFGVGEDLRRIDSEISKLELLAYPEKTITKKYVDALGLNCENIFTFADFLAKNNKQKAQLELAKLLDKDEPLRILGFLQSTVRKWIAYKMDLRSMSCLEMSKKHNIHEFRLKKELEKIASMSVENLIDLQKNITTTEFKIKSGKLEPKLALEMMI